MIFRHNDAAGHERIVLEHFSGRSMALEGVLAGRGAVRGRTGKSDWSIKLPYRDRDDPLPTVADACRVLESDEDRAVARSLVLSGVTSGLATVGDLLDRLAAMAPSERRAALDQARSRAGLPTTREVDARRALAAYAPGWAASNAMRLAARFRCAHSRVAATTRRTPSAVPPCLTRRSGGGAPSTSLATRTTWHRGRCASGSAPAAVSCSQTRPNAKLRSPLSKPSDAPTSSSSDVRNGSRNFPRSKPSAPHGKRRCAGPWLPGAPSGPAHRPRGRTRRGCRAAAGHSERDRDPRGSADAMSEQSTAVTTGGGASPLALVVRCATQEPAA